MKKNKFYILFMLFLSIFIFSSCTQEKQKIENIGVASDGYRDMHGQKFIFRGSFINPNPRDYSEEEAIHAKEVQSDVIGIEQEKMMEAVDNVEKNTNCQIIRKSMNTLTASEFAAAFAAGQSPSDFIYGEIRFSRDLFVAGYIENIDNIEALDKTDYEKWGNAERQMSTTYKGSLYGFPTIGSTYYPYPNQFYGVLICNNDAYNNYGLETTPQEMVENGKWTFAKFKELISHLYVSDPVEPKYALIHSGLSSFAVYANGGDKVVKNKKGDYVFGYTRPEAIRAMEWVKSVYAMKDAVVEADPNKGIGLTQLFNGDTVFMLTNGYRAFSEIAQTMKNYSWLPFPYGPDVEYGSTCVSVTTFKDSVVSVMKNKNSQITQDAGYVMNELFEPIPHFGKTGYSDYLYRNYFAEGDRASFKVYLDMSKNLKYDYSLELGDVINSELLNAIEDVLQTGGAVSNTVASFSNRVNLQLNKEMNNKD